MSSTDREFESRSSQTKDYIGICCFSDNHATIRKKEQRLVDSESELCVRVELTDCYFSELAL